MSAAGARTASDSRSTTWPTCASRVAPACSGRPIAVPVTGSPGRGGRDARRVAVVGAARVGLVRAGSPWSTARLVGHAIYAPPAFLPGAAGFPTAPLSPDAVLLSTVYVDPSARRGGRGPAPGAGDGPRPRQPRHPRPSRPSGTPVAARRACVLPADFLGRVGFKTQRAHVTTPRMRMDLRTVVTWKSEVEARWRGCGAWCAGTPAGAEGQPPGVVTPGARAPAWAGTPAGRARLR